jgi:hypothetical protein
VARLRLGFYPECAARFNEVVPNGSGFLARPASTGRFLLAIQRWPGISKNEKKLRRDADRRMLSWQSG